MKVLLCYSKNHNTSNEGTRMLKNIQSALALERIVYTYDVYDYYDVAHFISLDYEKEIDIAKDKGVPVIVSAFYAEGYKDTSFLKYKIKNGHRVVTLKEQAFRVLNKVDLILVPTEYNARFLKDNGVTTKTQVCLSGIDIASYKDEEKHSALFHRYFQEDIKQPFILAFGEYTKGVEGLSSLIAAAKRLPNYSFYYVGTQGNKDELKGRDLKLVNSLPKNLKCVNEMPEDIHLSAIKNTELVIFPGYKPAGIITMEEAMASNKQLILRKSSVYPGLLEDGKTAYLAEFSETIVSLIQDYLTSSQQPTIKEAYHIIENCSLENYGKTLNNCYKKMMRK